MGKAPFTVGVGDRRGAEGAGARVPSKGAALHASVSATVRQTGSGKEVAAIRQEGQATRALIVREEPTSHNGIAGGDDARQRSGDRPVDQGERVARDRELR